MDQDIKIAGDKPSRDVERNRRTGMQNVDLNQEDIVKSRQLGQAVAKRFLADANASFSLEQDTENVSPEMMMQRRLLLSFTATVGFEQYCKDDTLSGIAQKAFLDELKATDSELYRTSSDTGAFSFYYLAFRRGSDVERRIGQTFAMLCSHDGDPIFQELGEALYCWFSSEIRKTVTQLGLN